MTAIPKVSLDDVDRALSKAEAEPPQVQPPPDAKPPTDLDKLLAKDLVTPKIRDGVVYCENMSQIRTLALHYIRAGMVPRGLEGKTAVETECRVMIAIEFGTSLGLTPLQSLQSVMIVNNRPMLWADSMMSLVSQHRDFRGHKTEYSGEPDKMVCTFRVFRNVFGETQETSVAFGVEDAKRAGLWGKPGPWSNYPKRMMMYRARAFCLRDAFPDALRGAGIVEEWEGHDDAAKATDDLQAKLDAIPSN